MALVIRNCFDVLADDEGIEYSNNINDAPKKKPAATTPPFPNARKKKNQKRKRKQASAMKKQETKSEATSMMRQAHGHDNFERKLSLKEYEKELLEKKKTLNLNHEERKLSLDKDFESMTLVGKKKEDYNGLLIKPAKPETKANKVYNNKVVDVNRFFQVPVTRSRRSSYAVDNGESTSTTNKADDASATSTTIININIEDDAQFPALN